MANKMMSFALSTDERAAILDQLRDIFPVGSYVSTVRMWRNRNGDAFDIMVLAPSAHEGVRRVSHLVAQAGIGQLNRDTQSVRVRGGGMDMAYDVVDSLSRALYGDGRALHHNAL